MENENVTASEILDQYSRELSMKVDMFVTAYNFYPIRPGTSLFEELPLKQQKYSFAFFSHPQIVMLEDRIYDWSEQCHLLKTAEGK